MGTAAMKQPVAITVASLHPRSQPSQWPLYGAVLERSCEGELWGIKLAVHRHIEGMVITDLSDSEVVQEWNEQNEEHPIQEGHVIIEVNGYRDHENMKQQFASSLSMQLLVCTEPSDLQQWAFDVFAQRKNLTAAVDAIIQKVEAHREGTNFGGCSICHDDMHASCGQGSQVVRLPCKHHFHESCVKRWLLTGNHRCPLCNHHLALGS
ncbi:Uncharacterized RING finger protein C57A7.09 [Durusdinium trenchii]|uniref:RING-type E3 ubiquitin transferase n=1 Tax=Durusdinium trenchii TaxID=1381693 RepID=A0ABP0S205_9DINO